MIYHGHRSFVCMIALLLLLPQSLFAYDELSPGVPPSTYSHPLSATDTTALNALSLVVQEFGQISLSMDAAGSSSDSITIQVEKASNATVRRAFLMVATTGFVNHRLSTGDIRLEGNPIAWTTEIPTSIDSYNYWADVTSIVKGVVDAAPAGFVDLAITEADSISVDGEILVVILDDPTQLTDNTVLLYFGAQNVDGDDFTIEFVDPVDKTDPNFRLDFSLGISFGYQVPELPEQYSFIDVNGNRLTSSAGGQDDGEPGNGALITVGGIGDTSANPPNPWGSPSDARTDDELYDLRDFVNQNDTAIQINTLNPSDDDNILFAGVFLGATRSVGSVAVDISLYNNPATAAERAPYESIIRYFADGLYESSNGANKLGRVTFYLNANHADEADILWVPSCHPSANPSGYGTNGLHVNMCDTFTDGSGAGVDYNFLSDDSHQQGGGYTLAHEFGHYYYSLYDEYKGNTTTSDLIFWPLSTDKAVANSIMNSQWKAIGGDYKWLNFSIAKNNTHANAQHRAYGTSAWETLIRPLADDPRDGKRIALAQRLYHEELLAVQPGTNQDATIELPGVARSALRIIWSSDAAARRGQQLGQGGSFPFSAQLTSVLGQNIAYPNPILLMAFVHKDLMITDLGITATVTLPNNSQQSVIFTDDGISPDAKAADGIYSAIVAVGNNGVYSFDVNFDNAANTSKYVNTSFTPPLGADGQPVPLLTPTPVNENFQLTKNLQVVVSNVVPDDHANTPARATNISTNNHSTAGRIDNAGDVDLFRFVALSDQSTYIRITNLALGMIPHLQIFTDDGTTIAYDATWTEEMNYLSVRIDGKSGGSLYYAAISDHTPDNTGGLYEISVGARVPSDPALPPAAITISAVPDRLIADGTSQSQIEVIVQDENSTFLGNQVVQWSTSLGSLNMLSTTTNMSGTATVLLTAPTMLGTALVNASTGSISTTTNILFGAGLPNVLTLSAAPPKIVANGSASTITATVEDAFNHGLPGQVINFSSSLGIISPSAITEADGIATVVLTAGEVSGFAQVIATSTTLTTSLLVEFEEPVGGTNAFDLHLPLIQR